MKGVVFTEFLEMAEDRFSLGVVDSVLRATAPASGGVYTSVGTYPVEELVGLLVQLSEQTRVPVPDLLKEFGGHLLRRFVQWYPEFFADARSSFDVLQSVEGHIHVEVRKLYAGADPPRIACEDPAPDRLLMRYSSKRKLCPLFAGLIDGTSDYFEVAIAQTQTACAQEGAPSCEFSLHFPT